MNYVITGLYDGEPYTYAMKANSLGEATRLFESMLHTEMVGNGWIEPGEDVTAWILSVCRSKAEIETPRIA